MLSGVWVLCCFCSARCEVVCVVWVVLADPPPVVVVGYSCCFLCFVSWAFPSTTVLYLAACVRNAFAWSSLVGESMCLVGFVSGCLAQEVCVVLYGLEEFSEVLLGLP